MLTFKILSTLIIIFLSIYFFILKIFHTFISFFPGFDNTTAVIGSAEQYYDYSVLKKIDDISGGIGMPDLKLTACLAACYLVLFLTLWKGSSFIYVFYLFFDQLGYFQPAYKLSQLLILPFC